MSIEETDALSMRSLKSVVVQSKMIEELKKLQHNTKKDDDESFDAEDIDDPFDMEDFEPGAKN